MEEKKSDNRNRYFWFKMKDTFFQETDIQRLEALENGERYAYLWLKLMVRTMFERTPGYLGVNQPVPYDERIIAKMTGTDLDTVRVAFKYYADFGMIEILDDKTLYLRGIEKFIGSECSSAERVRRMRDKRAQEEKLLEYKEPEQETKLEPELDTDTRFDKQKIDEDTDTEGNVTDRYKVTLSDEKSSSSFTKYREWIYELSKDAFSVKIDANHSLLVLLEELDRAGRIDLEVLRRVASGCRNGAAFFAKLRDGDFQEKEIDPPVCCNRPTLIENNHFVCSICGKKYRSHKAEYDDWDKAIEEEFIEVGAAYDPDKDL